MGGAANGAVPVLPDIAVAAADHGLAAAGAVPALDLNWVDSRLVSCCFISLTICFRTTAKNYKIA